MPRVLKENSASFISRFTLLVNPGTKKCAPTFVAKLLFGAYGRWNKLPRIFVLCPDLKPTIVVTYGNNIKT